MAYKLIGQTLGAYRIDALIGVGGMAEVYRAWQPNFERNVALKIMPADESKRPEFAERFRREAQMIAQLQHVHILPVFDFGEFKGRMFLVMPLMENGTIATRVRGRRVPLDQIIRVGTQVGDALAYAHQRGMVHCDVKPGNILLDERGNCLLSDFGIARLLGSAAADDDPLGTPAYMAPEQAAGTQIDGRADIFALGAVLYELCVGVRPYRKDDAYSQTHGAPRPPSSINSSIPQQLDWIVLRALAQKREDRFADAGEMVRALRALRAAPTRGTATNPPAPPGTHPAAAHTKPPRTMHKRFAWLPTLAVTFALLLIVLAVGSAFMPQPSAKSPLITPATPPPQPTEVVPCCVMAVLGPADFTRCPIALNEGFYIQDIHKDIGCPSQPAALNRAAAVIEYESGSVLYFAPPGSNDALRGVAYVLFKDGAALRIEIGGKLPTDRLGKRIADDPRATSAEFQSCEHGRVFRMRGYEDDQPISVRLVDGVRGDWRTLRSH